MLSYKYLRPPTREEIAASLTPAQRRELAEMLERVRPGLQAELDAAGIDRKLAGSPKTEDS